MTRRSDISDAISHHVIKEFFVNSPEGNPKGIFLMAHGAGRGMANPFMETIARGIVEKGIRVVRFHFPYMERMLRSGEKIRPDGGGILRQCFNEVIAHCKDVEKCPGKNLIIGGKSMGGRIASTIADANDVAGVICLGYPFHPPRKPNQWRIDELKTIRTPTLICQGERDAFGHREEVERQSLPTSIEFSWIKDGDHNFTPHASSGRTADDNLQDAIIACNRFIDRLL